MCCITIFILFCTDIFITIEVIFWLFTVFTWAKDFTIFCHPNSSDILLRNWFIDMMNISILIFHRTNIFITIKVILWLFAIFPWSQYMTINRFPDCLDCVYIFYTLQSKFWLIRVLLQLDRLRCLLWNRIQRFWCWWFWFVYQFWWLWVCTVLDWFRWFR